MDKGESEGEGEEMGMGMGVEIEMEGNERDRELVSPLLVQLQSQSEASRLRPNLLAQGCQMRSIYRPLGRSICELPCVGQRMTAAGICIFVAFHPDKHATALLSSLIKSYIRTLGGNLKLPRLAFVSTLASRSM